MDGEQGVPCERRPLTAPQLEYHFEMATKHGSLLRDLVSDYEIYLAEWSKTLASVQKSSDVQANASLGLVSDVGSFDLNVQTDLVMNHKPNTPRDSAKHSPQCGQFSVKLWPLWKEPSRIEPLQQPHQLVVDAEKDISLRVGDRSTDVNGWMGKLVQSPSAPSRLMWDALTLLVLCYDVLTLPLTVFDYDELAFAQSMRLSTLIFWTMDIISNFFVGYVRADGLEESDIRVIWARYLKRWFPVDFGVVAADWILTAIGDGSNLAPLARLGKAFRMTRLMRMIRLIRISKASEMFDALKDFISSAHLLAFLNICRLLGGLLTANHFIACAWYAIGVAGQKDLSKTWISRLEEENASTYDRYVVSFQWSISQFTPAASNFHPVNERERTFAIVVLVVGLVLFSALLGSVTSIINNARQSAYEAMRSEQLLVRFLDSQKISVELSVDIRKFLKQHFKAKRIVIESDVQALQCLPLSLKLLLHLEMHRPVLIPHVFFAFLHEEAKNFLALVCHACEDIEYLKGDEPFHFGTKIKGMMFLLVGEMEYFSGPNHGHKYVTKSDKIEKGHWLAEVSLWMEWPHMGSLAVLSPPCVVLLLDTLKFRKIVAKDGEVFEICRKYAKLFAKASDTALQDHLEVDDLWGSSLRPPIDVLSTDSIRAKLHE